MSSLSGTKTPGGYGGDYGPQGSADKGGVSHSVRKKIDAKKVELLKGWQEDFKRVLKVGAGLDVHLDSAMRELIDELKEWIDEF